jgi:hypothetical protein
VGAVEREVGTFVLNTWRKADFIRKVTTPAFTVPTSLAIDDGETRQAYHYYTWLSSSAWRSRSHVFVSHRLKPRISSVCMAIEAGLRRTT